MVSLSDVGPELTRGVRPEIVRDAGAENGVCLVRLAG
jgi:hypothetical protein